MVHFRALPGTPSSSMRPADIVAMAVAEAKQLESAGFDALIVENMHDRPYLSDASSADTVATFAVATAAVVNAVKIPVGVLQKVKFPQTGAKAHTDDTLEIVQERGQKRIDSYIMNNLLK